MNYLAGTAATLGPAPNRQGSKLDLGARRHFNTPASRPPPWYVGGNRNCFWAPLQPMVVMWARPDMWEDMGPEGWLRNTDCSLRFCVRSDLAQLALRFRCRSRAAGMQLMCRSLTAPSRN